MKMYRKLMSGFTLPLFLTLLFLSASVSANPFLQAPWPDTDFSKLTINLEEVMSGGPPRDGIPAIDQPKFDNVTQAARWLEPREPVIRVLHAGDARAYPLQLLIYHEITNDQIGDLPISVTFCPLCNSSVVFDRRFEGKVLDFGTTGLLRKSDMVMYDRQTDSWWQQIVGKGIVGEYAGAILTQVPSEIVSFEVFANAHPEGRVLNRDTGHSRPYGNNPYRGYDGVDNSPFLFRGELDTRLPPMERVMHIAAAGDEKLYPFSRLKGIAVVNDQVGLVPVVLFNRAGLLSVLDQAKIRASREIQAVTAFQRKLNGQTLTFKVEGGAVVDEQSGSKWNRLGQAVEGPLKGQILAPVQSGIHFAFAWLAFNPDVEMYQR